MARSTLSLGMLAPLAARMAVRSRGLDAGSPPPMRAAMLISRMMRVKTRPRFASVAPFLCLIVAHFECPDITHPLCHARPSGGLHWEVHANPQRRCRFLPSQACCAETYRRTAENPCGTVKV